MAEDVIREAATFQLHISALRRLIAQAFEKASPSDATDTSASARVFIGRSGLPERIEIMPDWQSKISPEEVGDAVVEAFQAAARKRVEAWAEALRSTGWHDRAGRLKRYIDNDMAPSKDQLPAAFKRGEQGVERRTLEEVTEDFLRIADQATKSLTPNLQARRPGIGWSTGKKVRIIVDDNGIKSCSFDRQWAQKRSSTELTRALSEALGAARSRLADRLEEESSSDELQSLFHSTLSLLADPGGLATS